MAESYFENVVPQNCTTRTYSNPAKNTTYPILTFKVYNGKNLVGSQS